MIKKCLGCGIKLQDKDLLKIGYTPDLKNKYCQRCFKIINYHENIKTNEFLKKEEILKYIKNNKLKVIFLIDFLNINKELIKTKQNINNKKILVLTKSDIIPKNIIINSLIKNIKDVYKIKEDILYINSKYNDNLEIIKSFIKKEKKVILIGLTSVGKSSLINSLSNSLLTVSEYQNTTLDIIKVKYEDNVLYDVPGFSVDYEIINVKKRIKPKVYQLENKYYLKILDFCIYCDKDNDFILYLSNDLKEKKKKDKEKFKKKIKVLKNSDLIIKGIGFIKIKEECEVFVAGKYDVEVRRSIIGGIHE